MVFAQTISAQLCVCKKAGPYNDPALLLKGY